MQCPKCPGTLEEKTYGRKINVQRCTDCHGLWCKPDVLAQMKKEWMAEAVLDSGDPKVGKAMDEVEDVKCPECNIVMEKTMDDRQTHIWYETCSNCGGMYLDAGEFTDLKYDTLMDRLRDLIKGKRPGA